jgi:hypothetical protein
MLRGHACAGLAQVLAHVHDAENEMDKDPEPAHNFLIRMMKASGAIAQDFATIREYLNEMYRSSAALKFACGCLAWVTLSSCAGGRTAGEHIADMPHWMGGLPADAPPRRGTPEYDEFMARRAQEAARPKTDQPK